MQLLSGLGLMAMIALRDPLRDTDAALGFAHGVGLGCLALAALSFVNFENPRFRRATIVPFVAAVGLAIALVMFGSGPGDSGVKVNLLGVQPIEAIGCSPCSPWPRYFSRRWELLRELSSSHGPTHTVRRFVKLPRGRDVQPLAVMLGVLFLFFFAQRDLGPALVLGCMSLALYGVARARAGLVLGGMLALVAGFTATSTSMPPSTSPSRAARQLGRATCTRAPARGRGRAGRRRTGTGRRRAAARPRGSLTKRRTVWVGPCEDESSRGRSHRRLKYKRPGRARRAADRLDASPLSPVRCKRGRHGQAKAKPTNSTIVARRSAGFRS